MKKTQISKAIAMVCFGTAVSAASISTASAHSTTMYNLYHENGGVSCAPCSGNATDGWVYGFQVSAIDPETGNPNPVVGWVGTDGPYLTPFGYAGAGALHWGVDMHGAGEAEISNEDSLKYGISADIDVAKGSWSDAAQTGQRGWRHNLDFGVFKSNISGIVTLAAQGVNQTGTNFGFTVFEGMDTSTGGYGHHGPWNVGSNAAGLSLNSLPRGGTTFAVADIVAYSVGATFDEEGNQVAPSSNLNEISFYAEADQEYTIAMGGYRNGHWGQTNDGYVLSMSLVSIYRAPLEDLMSDVESLNLKQGLEQGLIKKLENALSIVEDEDPSNDNIAVDLLNSFINQINAKRGKDISDEEADALVDSAQAIIDSMSM